MKLKIILFLVSLLFLRLFTYNDVAALTLYETPVELSVEEIIESFRLYQTIEDQNLSIPSLIKFPVDYEAGSSAVLEKESNTFQPHQVTVTKIKVPFTVESGGEDDAFLNDGNPDTYAEYPLGNENGENSAMLTFSYERPVNTFQLNFILGENVQLPDAVSIIELRENSERYLLSRKPLSNNTVSFPTSTASSLRVIFYYRQPLRISEISFNDSGQRITQNYLLFLVRPGFNYLVYSFPEGEIPYIRVPEAGNFETGAEIVEIARPPKILNPYFKEADVDKDGIADKRDNCRNIFNPDQVDINVNRIGDACEDFDLDGVLNSKDNCPDKPNRLQQDSDYDGIGDHCDSMENRIIERLPFLPWLGIGIGFIIVVLIFKTAVTPPEATEKPAETHKSPDTSD